MTSTEETLAAELKNEFLNYLEVGAHNYHIDIEFVDNDRMQCITIICDVSCLDCLSMDSFHLYIAKINELLIDAIRADFWPKKYLATFPNFDKSTKLYDRKYTCQEIPIINILD